MATPARKRPAPRPDADALRRENHRLRARLAEAEHMLDAIRRGAADALVVSGPDGEHVYTLQGADSSYRTMVETMHAGAATLDRDGTVLYANARMAEMLDRPLEQVMGTPLADFVTLEDLGEFHRLLREGGDRAAAGEVRLRTAAGAPVPVHLAVRLLDSPDLKALCLVATDLTERKRSEAALREADRRYRLLFDRTAAGVYQATLNVHTRKSRCLDCNESYARIMGYDSAAEMVDAPAVHVFPSEDAWRDYTDRLIADRQLSNFELCLQRKDGTPFWALINVGLSEPDAQGEALMEGTLVDITERKQAEEALRRVPELLARKIEERTVELKQALESLEREMAARQALSTFPEQNPHPVLRVRQDGLLLYANPASAPMLESWGCQEGRLLPEELRQEFLESLALNAAQELELVCGARIYSLACTPHPAQGYVNVYGRDITKRKRIEAQQERLVKDLEAVNQELRQFAYVVSHDLKAPLRAISALAGWLRKDYADKLGGEAAEHLVLLEGRARRLNTLIDGVLEYSRLGRTVEPRVPVDLRAAVGEVLDLLGWPPAVRIHLGPLPTVMAIRMPLQQILLNLLQNAIKFNDKPQPEVRIACEAVPGYWQVSVADNGPGIAERHFDKIFLMFRTLAPRDKVESTGIGLALAKKAVELQGGRIWVTSREGEGATFWFTLPRDENVEGERTVAAE
ncbi:MAG: PAS domain S-box protein [Candidatus Methylomirabilales bacterium]